jgi:hypothetical protein
MTARIATAKHGGDRKSKNQEQNSTLEQATIAKAAKSMNVSSFSVKAAKTVLKEGGPGLVAAVVSGAMKVSKAARAVDISKKGKSPALLKKTVKAKADPVKADALYVWYELGRFVEKKLIEYDPKKLLLGG